MARTVFLMVAVILVGCNQQRPDSKSQFHKMTGLHLPSLADVATDFDDHGGVFGDGEAHLVFQCSKRDSEGMVSALPPWNATEWIAGPVPMEIQSNCITTSRDFMNAEDAVYAATADGPSEMPWHNGRLLVINPSSGDIHLFWWDN